MEQRIKNFHSVMGLRIMIASIMLGVILVIALRDTEQATPVAVVFGALFVLGAAFIAAGRHRERNLVRLRANGNPYDADSIDYAPANWINMMLIRDYAVFRACFNYIDHSGDMHTTGTRWYAVKLDKTETYLTPLDNFKFSAKVYVNPDSTRDYAVEMFVEG